MLEYKDDLSISDEAELWRRVPPWHFVPDKNTGKIRPSSAAFENHRNGSPMSIILEEIIREYGKGPKDALRGNEDYALAALMAGLVRENKQGVARDPLPEEPAHGVVFGKKTKSICRKLARGSTWVIPPISKLE